MTLGEKIKAARRAKMMTQESLVKDKITRNMLSRIENGKANPSIETIKFLADELSLPVSYLLSEDDDILFYEKKEKMNIIYQAYADKDYSYCVSLIGALSSVDSELAYILAASYFEMAKIAILKGSLKSALKYAELSDKNCDLTVLNTEHIRSVLSMYKAIASNIQSPLLEFDPTKYTDGMSDIFDYDMFRYLMQDYEYKYTDKCISLHVAAKLMIKERRYSEAISYLTDAIDLGHNERYNAFVMFGIYTDLEQCYKQTYNFEKAYQFASKRLSMIEGFKS